QVSGRGGARRCLAISTPAVLPSVGRKTSAPRTCLTPLNTSPAPSPVNASRLPSRTTRASLGASAVVVSRRSVLSGVAAVGLAASASIVARARPAFAQAADKIPLIDVRHHFVPPVYLAE